MKQHISTSLRRLACLSTLSALGLMLGACGGGGDGAPTPRVTESVPAAVVTNPAAATGYTGQLADTSSMEGDTLEPVAVPDQMATDDTAEPA